MGYRYDWGGDRERLTGSSRAVSYAEAALSAQELGRRSNCEGTSIQPRLKVDRKREEGRNKGEATRC